MTLLTDLVETSQRVGRVRGRNAKVEAIAELLARLSPEEIGLGVAYLAGETLQGRKGIGYATIRDAHPAAAATAPTLTLQQVDAALEAVATTSGRGSVGERKRLLASLMAAATADEQAFLVRLLLGELRQGALEGLMIEAVAVAAALPVADVRRAAMLAGGIAAVATAAMTGGAHGLRRFAITLFQPLAPMLAQPADDIEDALSRIPAASLEWKLDGARVQVHRCGRDVRIFSRTGNDVTAAAPEIVDVALALGANELILDGEAIALRADDTPYPFQDTMRRFGRVLDIDAMRSAMPLSVFFFDCLRIDGEDLIGRPASERLEAMSALMPPKLRMPRLVTDDPGTAQAF